MKEFEDIVKLAYLVLIGFFLILIVGRYWYYKKTKNNRVNVFMESRGIIILRILTIISLPIFATGVINFIFILQKGNLFAETWMKNIFLLLFFVYVISEIIYNVKIIQRKTSRILNIIFTIFVFFLGLYLTNLFTKANQYPNQNLSISIDLPFKGKWIATGAGATGLTNHHDRIPSQKYAIDISKIGNNGKLFTGEGKVKEESNTFGAKIYSPVNGEIVHIVNNLPDTPIKERDKLAGNHIIIKFQDTLYVALAHLKNSSFKVNIGDFVTIGQELARVGLSGNTDFCHLHIHIQDTPIYDIDKTRTYPIRFKKFKRKRYFWWVNIENGYLLSNDLIESL